MYFDWQKSFSYCLRFRMPTHFEACISNTSDKFLTTMRRGS